MILQVGFDSVKAWLESYDSSCPVADTAFPERDENGRANRVTVPFIVFLDTKHSDGDDFGNVYVEHGVIIEFYTKDGDDSEFETFISNSGLHFTKEKNYLSKEQMFQAIYDLDDALIEK